MNVELINQKSYVMNNPFISQVSKLFSLLVIAALLTTGCEKEDFTRPVPQADDFRQLKERALAERTQTATFDAEDGIAFATAAGAQLNIAPNSLRQDGNPVTGPVDLALVELYNRADMLVTNKSTMAITPNGDLAPLVSGGEFFIEVTQNGDRLELASNMTLLVPADLTGGGDPDMTLWQGNVDPDGDIVWEEQQDADGTGRDGLFVEGQGEGAQYYASFGDFGWTNVDRFYNDPRPKTTLQVTVPEGYDHTNAAVYLSYDGEPNTLAQLDTYDPVTETFSEHYGQIPVGLEMHVIFVTEENGQWRYAIQGVTVAADDVYHFSFEDTTTGSEQDLVDAIDQLP